MNYGNKKNNIQKAPDVSAGLVEYKMSKVMADGILKGKNGKDPQQVLCDYVNTQLGLKGYCVRVLVDIN